MSLIDNRAFSFYAYEYIDYYNNQRITVKLKGLTPVQYRNQSLLTA